MAIEFKAITYEEARMEFFIQQRDAAKRRIEYWCKPGNAVRVGAFESHCRASQAGEEYAYYTDAIDALNKMEGKQ